MIQGTLGQVSTTKRSEGVIKALKDNGINPVEASAPVVADYDRPTAPGNDSAAADFRQGI